MNSVNNKRIVLINPKKLETDVEKNIYKSWFSTWDDAIKNDLKLTRLDSNGLREVEPHIAGTGALLSPSTGIVDYLAVTNKMADLFAANGGEIRYGADVTHVHEEPNDVALTLKDGSKVKSRHVISCAGLQADRLASMCGVGDDFAIVPFKGEYFQLASRHNDIVKHLIYPIPDPDLPFLGIHLTRMTDGGVTVGPNAVLSFAREDYSKWGFSTTDVAAMMKFPGFWKTIFANLGSGLHEMRNSAFRSKYLRACQKYCPSLELDDLQPYPAGIRAQAVMRDGTLVHDFLIRETDRTIHICNAPSPAATSAIPIARHIRDLAARIFSLKGL